jgi:hypothetical protein
VAHTAHVELDDKLILTTAATVNAGGFFRLQGVAVPADTSNGKHTLKVTILPEKLVAKVKIFVCQTSGAGCEFRLGFADDPAHHSITSFFGTTKLALNEGHILIGGGIPVQAGQTDPVATATVYIDNTELGTADVYSDGTSLGAFRFNSNLEITTGELGNKNHHQIRAVVNGQTGEISFTV